VSFWETLPVKQSTKSRVAGTAKTRGRRKRKRAKEKKREVDIGLIVKTGDQPV
jgi:hypothetical protein